MFKETLQTAQPTVYRTLHNALEKKQLSHCYLFVGPKGTYKKETAFLLAQSLICHHGNPFACEQCSDCRRLEEGNYVDFIYLDGSEKSIKIEAIENLQKQFEKTALEAGGHKIFVIDGCENLTAKAANSLLKFIEEPTSEMTGIFIASQPDRVLPTIVSRCQTLNFKPLTKEAFYQEGLNQGLDELDAHFISQLVNSCEEIARLAGNKAYNQAVEIFFEFSNLFFTKRNEAILYLQNRFSKLNKTDKNNLRDTMKYFVDIALIFVSDYLNDYTINDETHTNLIQIIKNRGFDYEKYLQTMIETRDALNKNANGLLLIDQMLYKLLEV